MRHACDLVHASVGAQSSSGGEAASMGPPVSTNASGARRPRGGVQLRADCRLWSNHSVAQRPCSGLPVWQCCTAAESHGQPSQCLRLWTVLRLRGAHRGSSGCAPPFSLLSHRDQVRMQRAQVGKVEESNPAHASSRPRDHAEGHTDSGADGRSCMRGAFGDAGHVEHSGARLLTEPLHAASWPHQPRPSPLRVSRRQHPCDAPSIGCS